TDDLQKLGAKIDYTNQTVQLKNRCIPLVIERTTPLKPTRLEYVNHITIPVKIENVPVVVPEFEINGIIFPDCIATARDFHVTINIPVEHSTPEEICCIEPMDVDPLLEYNIKKPDIQENDFNITQLIRTDHLSPDEKQKILELCQKYKTVFHFEGTDLTCTHHVKHKIRTTDDIPIYQKPLRYPPVLQEEINLQVQKLIDNKIVRPSISPYSSQV
ncbi:unnamed protein product, partial [Acanthoscelides obtectus]